MIWGVLAGMVFYLLYAGITGVITIWVWVCIGAVLVECLVLALNKWKCPLTPIAVRYTDNRMENFDIYLPVWLARYNKIIFSTLFVLALILIVLRAC